MERYRLLLSPSTRGTKVLFYDGPDTRVAGTLLEARSLWLDAIPVASCVDAKDAGFCLGRTDEMGIGLRSVYYRVAVSELATASRRGVRIPGVGDFRDLRAARRRHVEERS